MTSEEGSPSSIPSPNSEIPGARLSLLSPSEESSRSNEISLTTTVDTTVAADPTSSPAALWGRSSKDFASSAIAGDAGDAAVAGSVLVGCFIVKRDVKGAGAAG